jgi:hypothetical protein
MKSVNGLLMCSLFVLVVALGGCCCGGNGETTTVIEKQPVPVSTTPLGDELIKLKEAHEKGALTDKEYENAKEKLLKGQ